MTHASLLGTMDQISSFEKNSLVLSHRKLSFLKNTVLTTQLGFGSYRIHESVSEHEIALLGALQSGVNLVDTAANYSFGGSETLIGKVLQKMGGNPVRNRFIFVSKAGYVQGTLLQEVKKDPYLSKNLVFCFEGCFHSMDPDFLQSQLDTSLQRLGLDCLDVYLLQNPEAFLVNAKSRNIDRKEAWIEYEKRLYQAFLWFEKKVMEGTIAWYGISSETLNVSSDTYEFTDLDRIVSLAFKAAEAVSSDVCHFQVIQFPLNPCEHQAVTLKNQKIHNEDLDLFSFCQRRNLDILLTRPLSGFYQNRWIRFARREFDAKRDYQDIISRAFEDMKEAESEISCQKGPCLHLYKEFFAYFNTRPDPDSFLLSMNRYWFVQAQNQVNSMQERLAKEPFLADYVEKWLEAFEVLEKNALEFLNRLDFEGGIERWLLDLEPLFGDPLESWSCRILNWIASQEKKAVILNGMRTLSHVRDSTRVLILDSLAKSHRLNHELSLRF